jgi:hypothetical protein
MVFPNLPNFPNGFPTVSPTVSPRFPHAVPRPALSRARDESDSEDELPPLPEMLRFPEAEVRKRKGLVVYIIIIYIYIIYYSMYYV